MSWRILLFGLSKFYVCESFCARSPSKVCLRELVMHFQALNDPVPWGYLMCSQLRTRTVGWSKFNKSDLPNTMVKPESSWATRTQLSKIQCHGPGPDVTHTAGPVCVCARMKAHVNSFWRTAIYFYDHFKVTRSNSYAAALIRLSTSFCWLILQRAAAVSQMFTPALVNSFRLCHHDRKETTTGFSEEMRNCKWQMFPLESAWSKIDTKVTVQQRKLLTNCCRLDI